MSIRLIYILGFIIISVLMVTSLYVQYFDGFMPCPLCILQRAAFITLGILFVFGILLAAKRWGRWTIAFLSSFVSLCGVFFAGRQVWLQHFPPADNSECGVSLHYMLQVLPMNEVVQKVFAGSAECSERGWDFLNLNMAEWSLIWFLLFFGLSIYLICRNITSPKSNDTTIEKRSMVDNRGR